MNDETLRDVLSNAKTIAVVGLSSNPVRPSYGVSEYMQSHGYRIIPVKPNETEVLGEKAYVSLEEMPSRLISLTFFVGPSLCRNSRCRHSSPSSMSVASGGSCSSRGSPPGGTVRIAGCFRPLHSEGAPSLVAQSLKRAFSFWVRLFQPYGVTVGSVHFV